MNIADEILVKRVLAQGGLSLAIYRRVTQHGEAAEEAGADVVALSSSSISPCADAACAVVEIRVLRANEPMVDKPVELETRIRETWQERCG